MSVESNLEIYKIILGRKTFRDVIYEKNDIPVETVMTNQEIFNILFTNIRRTREKKAGNWEIMQTVGRLFNTQRASVVVMRS